MQNKPMTTKPFLLLLYGYPGSGKTFFARQFAESMPAVHLHADKFQHELHEVTHGQATGIASTLLKYMTKEFLHSGVSVILDASLTKKNDRKMFRKLANSEDAEVILVWFQIDPETSFKRTQQRDRRKNEDKYAAEYSISDFQSIVNESQNPDNEDYVVVSGKHTFNTQKGTVMKKLFEKGLLSQNDAAKQVVKPGLVNLVPQALRDRRNGEFPRRNISIR